MSFGRFKHYLCPKCKKQIKIILLVNKADEIWECEKHGELTEVLVKN